ncbi:MAG: PAS domain-containing protein [Rhodospirillaceae bacterium]|nr:PAS domain-containing protein [Rhodospirillaceae bacterium]
MLDQPTEIPHLMLPRHAGTRLVLAHWLALYRSNENRIPERGQLDPLQFAKALDEVFIYEFDGADFVCRLVGERTQENFGFSLRNRPMREILGKEVYPSVFGFFKTCIDSPAIYKNIGLLYSDPDMDRDQGERLLLPTRSGSGVLNHVFGCTATIRADDDEPSQAQRELFRFQEGEPIADAPPIPGD